MTPAREERKADIGGGADPPAAEAAMRRHLSEVPVATDTIRDQHRI
jgi:hypothetical protein